MEGSDTAGHALLVGVPGGGLFGTANDLRAMEEMLVARGFTVDVRTGDRATRKGILDGYDQLIRLSQRDPRSQRDRPAVFYYTGHGFHAVLDKEQGRSWQGIVPTDMDDTTTTDFRGITAWELSIKQAQLTRQTWNVTVILDCCYASQMSRDGAVSGAVPRALPHPFRLGFDEHLRALERMYGVAYNAVDPLGNPNAVRLVACGPGECAYECQTDDGQYHGVLTTALLEVLRDVGAARVSWAALDDVIRARVLRRNVLQRPDIEGPARRLPFSLDEDRGGDAAAILEFPGKPPSQRFRILVGSLRGVLDGDVFAIMPPGSPAYRAADAIAELKVTQTTATYAAAELASWKSRDATLPEDAVAFPIEKRAIRRPVRIDAPDPERTQILAAVEASPTLRPVQPEDTTALATLRLRDGALTIGDDRGPLFAPMAFRELPGMVKNVANLAAVQTVRELAGAHGVAADEVEIEWGTVERGRKQRMPARGGSLALRDWVYVQVRKTSSSQRTLYAHIFNLGVRGKITLLTAQAFPGGVPLVSGAPAYVLGQQPDGTLPGLKLSWPSGMPRETFPRMDEIVVIITAKPTSLRSLETVEYTAMQRGGGGSKLQDLLAQVHDGQTRSLRGEEPIDGFLMERLTYFLHPREVAMADIPFAVDDNPLRLAAARAHGAWLVPGESVASLASTPMAIVVRLTDLIVHSGRTLSANLRIDALICTRATGDSRGYAAWTRRFRGVSDGQRLDLDTDVVFSGVVQDFIDVYLWISADRDGDLTLEQLIAQRATSPEIADAAAALSTGAGARGGPWIAAVAASAILSRVAYESLGGAERTTGLYRTAFIADDNFGIGRHSLRAGEISCSVSLESVRSKSVE